MVPICNCSSFNNKGVVSDWLGPKSITRWRGLRSWIPGLVKGLYSAPIAKMGKVWEGVLMGWTSPGLVSSPRAKLLNIRASCGPNSAGKLDQHPCQYQIGKIKISETKESEKT